MTKSENSKTSRSTTVKTTPIAIIGLGSIFPQAHSTADYWNNILAKIDCISDVPESRWSIEDYYDPNPSTPDKTYCKRGAFIPDIDFDPLEFGLPPNILEVTDVSQLLALVVAKQTLEDAGYGEDKTFDREHTGVVLGVVGMSSKLFTPLMTRLQYPVWEKVLRSAGIAESDTKTIVDKMKLAYVNWEENAFPGAIGNVIAGRICNRFDLGGVNCVVDAACASSLAALKMAVGELIEGRANMMITGGVDADNTINTYMCFSKTPAFSKGEHVRTFDAASDGMMVGEGIGMVALKRLEDAERDGDRIYAVIHAIGTSSDGRYKSIYAPRPSGQAVALRRAYDEAGFSPATVGLIEAHGTGTMAGDPAEFEGLRTVFGESGAAAQSIALGSVKSQIAHTKAAAGVASLIKTALALHHKVLPPTINVTQPNPKFQIETTPFYINTEARPWIRAKNSAPRRAGVSSFGFGGTNFHVVMQEYNGEQTGAYRRNRVARPVLLSAASPAELLPVVEAELKRLNGAAPEHAFALLTRESRARAIPVTDARVGFVAETAAEAAQILQICAQQLQEKQTAETWEHPKGIFYRRSALEVEGRVVALFSGQGSQYLEMGRELAMNFPTVRNTFAALDDLFVTEGLEPLSDRVYPKPVFAKDERDALAGTLTRTEHAQPAIGALSVALFRILREAGLEVDFTAGHSFGELTALWAAGVIDDAGYFALAKARGKAMAPPDDPNFDAGSMAAVKADGEAVRAALRDVPDVTLANWNSNNQVVIAGAKAAMARAQEKLAALGMQTIPLPVSAAFHTALVGHAQKPFADAIASVSFHKPKLRVYANGSGAQHPNDPKAIRAALEAHILNPVRFRDEVEQIYQDGGRIFIEFGPKNVLTNLVENILEGKPHLSIALNASPKKDSDRQLREAVMALRVAGLPLVNFDPFALDENLAEPRKHSAVTVKINGGHYVSPKTRQAFQDALVDGFRVTLPQQNAAHVTAQPAAITAPAPVLAAPASTSMSLPVSGTIETTMTEPNLSQYDAHQTETARLHEQYLALEEEYARAFGQLTQLQSQLVQKAANAPGELAALLPLFESLERSMARFHDHQAETLRVHARYLETQSQMAQSLSGLPATPSQRAGAATTQFTAPVNGNNGHAPAPLKPVAPVAVPAAPSRVEMAPPPAPVLASPAPVVKEPAAPAIVSVPAPVAAPAASSPAAETAPAVLQSALLAIVSEKTGYPTETLELDMDMEADLGIDSIKRVEILGAMQEQFPSLPKVEAAVLAELRTLGQIVSQMSQSSLASPASAPAAVQAAAVPAPVVGVSAEALTNALLQIVSEKTGYPTETLELDMDMEADLGIDSIKRVEILGAMQEQFPSLPKLEAAVLAELRTLGQITHQLQGAGSAAQPSAGVTANSPFDGAEDSSIIDSSDPGPGVHQGIVARKLLPPPDSIQFSLPDGRVCLITDEGTALTARLARALRAQNWPVVVLRLPQSINETPHPLPDDVQTVALAGLEEAQIHAALQQVHQYGQVSAFVHLAPCWAEADAAFSETQKELVKLAFLAAKYLQPALTEPQPRAAFVTVTRLDGMFGLGAYGGFIPVTGGLFGLVKTLNLEWESVFCRAIDLSRTLDDARAVEDILAELHDPNRLLVEVGYTETERSTLTLAEPQHTIEQPLRA